MTKGSTSTKSESRLDQALASVPAKFAVIEINESGDEDDRSFSMILVAKLTPEKVLVMDVDAPTEHWNDAKRMFEQILISISWVLST